MIKFNKSSISKNVIEKKNHKKLKGHQRKILALLELFTKQPRA
jgi:hypothetical protein